MYTQVTDNKDILIDSVTGNWNFNKLKFSVILTEQKNGMWATRIDGPDYLKVDSIKVNALPKDKIADVNSKKFYFLAGAGYKTLIDFKTFGAISIYGGVEIKQKNIILFDASTNSYIGVSFIRKF